MKIDINNQEYNLIIEKKKTTRNTYIRVKEDLGIYVTCNTFTSDNSILKLIRDNEKNILKMIERIENKKKKEESFYYLGKKYDLIYLNNKDISFGETKVFVPENFSLDKWLKKEAEQLFSKELDRLYHLYKYEIPYPSLCIRKMKTRWGVCNTRLKKVTLNLELMKKDISCLDYVIVHELSHLIHPNHSQAFWKCVEDNYPDYKKVRKELKYE